MKGGLGPEADIELVAANAGSGCGHDGNRDLAEALTPLIDVRPSIHDWQETTRGMGRSIDAASAQAGSRAGRQLARQTEYEQIAHLLSRAQPNLIGTVGNRRNAFDLGVTQRTTRQSRNF